MKTKLLLLAAFGAAVLGYVLMPQVSEKNPPAVTTALVTESESKTSPLSERQFPPSPEGEINSEEAAVADSEDLFEIVYGMKVLKNRKCTIERHYLEVGNGTVVESFSCVPNEEREPGVYDSYDDATLAQMAYADALAAEVLGKRLSEDDPSQSRALLLRSVALRPENTDPLHWLAGINYGLVSRNDVPAVGEMSQNYLLMRVAEEFGSSGAAEDSRRRLVAAGLDAEEFLALEQKVLNELAKLREIQIAVNGQSELPEASL